MRNFLLLILLCLTFATAYTQVTNTVTPYGYAGRRFMVAFMQNEVYYDTEIKDLHQIISISTTQRTNVKVENYLTGIVNTYNLPADTVLWIRTPIQNENFDSEVGRMKGIEVTADQPILVYCLSSSTYTSDAYSAIPTLHWGREYMVVSMPNTTWGYDEFVRTGEFLLIGSEDNTLVTYIPNAKTERNYDVAEPVYIRLNKGETYLVRSTPDEDTGNDLTGTHITSDKPIGVLSGHVRTTAPAIILGLNDDSRNHIIEMLLPTNLWGTEYISIPFTIPSPDPDIMKVVAIEPNTVITVKGQMTDRTITLDSTGAYATLAPFVEPLLWKSDKPFSLVQIMPTSQENNNQYDPSMVVVPPTKMLMQEALVRSFDYKTSSFNPFRNHFLTILCDSLARDSLRMNGVLLNSLYPGLLNNVVPNTKYCFVNFRLPENIQKLTTNKGFFTGTLYGTGAEDAYSLTLGGILFSPEEKENIPPIIYANTDCGIVDGYVKELAPPEGTYIRSIRVVLDSTVNYSWKINTISDTSTFVTFRANPVNPTKNGYFLLEATDNMGNTQYFRYRFQALGIEYTDSLFYEVLAGQKECKFVTIKNTGNKPISIGGGTLTGDTRLKFGASSPNGVPHQSLAPGQSVKVEICFDPLTDTTVLNAQFTINLPCNLQLSTALLGSTIFPSLLTRGHNYGDIVLGDTNCADILFVNNGNMDITLKYVEFKDIPAFKIDTTGVFPIVLLKGDTLKIPVCYLPKNRKKDSLLITCINSYNLPDITATVKGRGIAPLINSAIIDWKKIRVGITRDSSVKMINIGNMPANITHIHNSGDTLFFDEQYREIVQSVTVYPNDTLTLRTAFSPLDTIKYEQSSLFTVSNWKLHPPVSITMSGEGTLPYISKFDNDFDTIKLHSFKNDIVTLYKGYGNERLTVDSVYFLNGDKEAFIFNNEELKGKITEPHTTVNIPVQFFPQKLGKSEAHYVIVSDALPAYKRKHDTVTFTGYAIFPDTTDFSFEIIAPDTVYSCTDTSVNITITNKGNVPLRIDSVYFTSGIFSEARLYDKILEVKQSTSEEFSIISIPSDGLNYTLRIVCNDTIIREYRGFVSARINEQKFTRIAPEDTTVTIGTEYSLIIAGEGKPQKGVPYPLTVNVEYNPDIFYLLNNDAKISIIADNIPNTYTLPIQRVSNTIFSIEIPEQYTVGAKVQWRIPLQYLVLLDKSKGDDFTVTVSSGDKQCFNDLNMVVSTSVAPVCADPIRAISHTAPNTFILYQVRPHPAGIGDSELFMASPDEGEIRLELSDRFGCVVFTRNDIVNKGFNDIKLLLTDIESGYYTLRVYSSFGTRTLPIIIQK